MHGAELLFVALLVGVVGLRLLPFGLAVFAWILGRWQTLRLGAALRSRNYIYNNSPLAPINMAHSGRTCSGSGKT